MTKVGICGFGGLGHVHGNTLWKLKDVQVVAVCDIRPEMLEAKKVEINIATEQSQFDIRACHTYTDFRKMLRKEKLDVLVTALPTDLHAKYAVMAMDAGCHVFSEKPMAISVPECDRMIEARDRNRRQLAIGQCLRFWPEYIAFREAIRGGAYGRLLSLTMQRFGSYPQWTSFDWMMDANRSGGAMLDLHLHDVDWVVHALGAPARISAVGRPGRTGGIDDMTTVWEYAAGPVVTMQSSWMAWGFTMNFRAYFESGMMEYGFPPVAGLTFVRHGSKERETLKIEDGNGYEREMRYFLDCVAGLHANETCSAESTRESILRVAQEFEAIRKGRPVFPEKADALGKRRTKWRVPA